MKLVHCRNCDDVLRLRSEARKCACSESAGRYVDKTNANRPPTAAGTSPSSEVRKALDDDGSGFGGQVVPKKFEEFKREEASAN